MPKIFVAVRKTVIEEIIGGDGPNPSDAFSLGVKVVDTNTAPADAAAYAFGLALADTSAAPSDLLQIGLTPTDANAAPIDAFSSVVRLWGNGSAGAGVANPANADGPNNATTAVVSTAPAGSATETLTSNCGNGAPAGTVFTTVTFRGWYRLQTTLSTSTAKVVLHSSTAAFTDVILEALAAAAGDNNHLTVPFSVDVSATLDTLAKLQSAQIVYSTLDAAAGISPAVVTVDASSLELQGVF